MKNYTALDIILHCKIAHLPECILQAAFRELAEYREKILRYESDKRKKIMTTLLILSV